jgi:hypothetical protein
MAELSQNVYPEQPMFLRKSLNICPRYVQVLSEILQQRRSYPMNTLKVSVNLLDTPMAHGALIKWFDFAHLFSGRHFKKIGILLIWMFRTPGTLKPHKNSVTLETLTTLGSS